MCVSASGLGVVVTWLHKLSRDGLYESHTEGRVRERFQICGETPWGIVHPKLVFHFPLAAHQAVGKGSDDISKRVRPFWSSTDGRNFTNCSPEDSVGPVWSQNPDINMCCNRVEYPTNIRVTLYIWLNLSCCQPFFFFFFWPWVLFVQGLLQDIKYFFYFYFLGGSLCSLPLSCIHVDRRHIGMFPWPRGW